MKMHKSELKTWLKLGKTGLLYEWTSMDDRKLKAKFIGLEGT